MKCYQCGTEMKKGWIYNLKGTDITWTPDGMSPHIVNNHIKEGEILLKKGNLIRSTKIRAYRCEKCKYQIIIDNDVN